LPCSKSFEVPNKHNFADSEVFVLAADSNNDTTATITAATSSIEKLGKIFVPLPKKPSGSLSLLVTLEISTLLELKWKVRIVEIPTQEDLEANSSQKKESHQSLPFIHFLYL